MRTGEFSRITELSKDTIYFYIEKGLIYPKRESFNYSFSNKDVETVQLIKLYQEMKFSLDEIISIISLWNWSNNIEESVIKDNLNRLSSKKKEIQKDIDKLIIKKNLITSEINRIHNKNRQTKKINKIGFPINKLDLICCSKCHKQFSINNASIDSKYIFNADLTCQCGNNIKIKNGILLTGNEYKDNYDKPDINRELYLNMPASYYKSLNMLGNEILRHLSHRDLNNKIIMETNINGFSFLYSNLKYLNGDFTTILIDKYPEVLLNYKNQLSKILDSFNIIFIADDSLEYPIKFSSVDIVLSLFSGNEHQLYKKEDYFDHISRYMSLNGSIIGGYQSYPKGSKSISNLKNKYREAFKDLYIKSVFLTTLKIILKILK